MRAIDDIHTTAIRYGKWANEGHGLGYPAIEPFLKEAEKWHHGIPVLDDDTALKINACTIKMRAVTPELFQAFMLRFVSGKSINKICQEMDVSDGTVKKYIYAALQSLKLLLTENQCIFIA